jgi:predicted ATPase
MELVSVMDPAFVPQAVAKAFPVREAPNQNITDTLAHFLKKKDLLLVLDNCEHLTNTVASRSEPTRNPVTAHFLKI